MKNRVIALMLLMLTTVWRISTANGQDVAQGADHFQSPSGNIFCSYFDLDGGTLRCDLGEVNNPQPPRPEECENDWGPMFEMNGRGMAQQICAGDTVVAPDSPILEYGQRWRRGEFRCSSSRAGIRCTNRSGHGWQLRKSEQNLF